MFKHISVFERATNVHPSSDDRDPARSDQQEEDEKKESEYTTAGGPQQGVGSRNEPVGDPATSRPIPTGHGQSVPHQPAPARQRDDVDDGAPNPFKKKTERVSLQRMPSMTKPMDDAAPTEPTVSRLRPIPTIRRTVRADKATRKCPQCGYPLPGIWHNRYCSVKCQHAHQMQTPPPPSPTAPAYEQGNIHQLRTHTTSTTTASSGVGDRAAPNDDQQQSADPHRGQSIDSNPTDEPTDPNPNDNGNGDDGDGGGDDEKRSGGDDGDDDKEEQEQSPSAAPSVYRTRDHPDILGGNQQPQQKWIRWERLKPRYPKMVETLQNLRRLVAKDLEITPQQKRKMLLSEVIRIGDEVNLTGSSQVTSALNVRIQEAIIADTLRSNYGKEITFDVKKVKLKWNKSTVVQYLIDLFTIMGTYSIQSGTERAINLVMHTQQSKNMRSYCRSHRKQWTSEIDVLLYMLIASLHGQDRIDMVNEARTHFERWEQKKAPMEEFLFRKLHVYQQTEGVLELNKLLDHNSRSQMAMMTNRECVGCLLKSMTNKKLVAKLEVKITKDKINWSVRNVVKIAREMAAVNDQLQLQQDYRKRDRTDKPKPKPSPRKSQKDKPKRPRAPKATKAEKQPTRPRNQYGAGDGDKAGKNKDRVPWNRPRDVKGRWQSGSGKGNQSGGGQKGGGQKGGGQQGGAPRGGGRGGGDGDGQRGKSRKRGRGRGTRGGGRGRGGKNKRPQRAYMMSGKGDHCKDFISKDLKVSTHYIQPTRHRGPRQKKRNFPSNHFQIQPKSKSKLKRRVGT